MAGEAAKGFRLGIKLLNFGLGGGSKKFVAIFWIFESDDIARSLRFGMACIP